MCAVGRAMEGPGVRALAYQLLLEREADRPMRRASQQLSDSFTSSLGLAFYVRV
jgi:hypothetical protein